MPVVLRSAHRTLNRLHRTLINAASDAHGELQLIFGMRVRTSNSLYTGI